MRRATRRATSSTEHWARDEKPPAPDEVEFHLRKERAYAWSGLTLFVDLQVAPEALENGENVGKTSSADHQAPQEDPNDDAAKGPGSSCSTGESCGHECDTEVIKDDLLTIHQRDCINLPNKVDEDECGGAAAEPDSNWTHGTWPDWGEPLPPEDLDDDLDVDDAAHDEENSTLKKAVTFSDVVTFAEPCSLQEERETDSFSYIGSSDEDLEQDKECLNSADVSAASHLLELGNELNYGESKALGFGSSRESVKRDPGFYDPSYDLERLSEVVEKLYAAVHKMSIVSSSQESIPSQEVGPWIVQVSKDSGKLRLKRIKREACDEGRGVLEVLDENEVLERPRWKRQYKSLRWLS